MRPREPDDHTIRAAPANLAAAPSASAAELRTPCAGHSAFWLLPPLIFLALAWASLSADLPVARWAAGRDYPRVVRELMSISEAFGHGVGVTLIVITIFVLDPARRRRLPWLIAAVLLAGLGANVVKLLVARERPSAADLSQADAAGTFSGWLPLAHNGSLHQSFPSAHTATAVGMALLLSALYPHGRLLFAVLAVSVGAQRILGSAHFLSDVMAGAAVGWFLALAVLRRGSMSSSLLAVADSPSVVPRHQTGCS